MKTFFTSDTHFFHENIIKYSNRPYKNAEEMNTDMILKWNKRVSNTDIIFHLGDFGFAPQDRLLDLFNQLNGQKYLIRGNHDKQGEKLPWIWVKDLYELSIDKKHVVLCHYGMRVWNKSHHGAIQLYGHSHGTLPPTDQSMDVGVDTLNDFYPYTFDEIQDRLKTYPKYAQQDLHDNHTN